MHLLFFNLLAFIGVHFLFLEHFFFPKPFVNLDYNFEKVSFRERKIKKERKKEGKRERIPLLLLLELIDKKVYSYIYIFFKKPFVTADYVLN